MESQKWMNLSFALISNKLRYLQKQREDTHFIIIVVRRLIFKVTYYYQAA